MPDIRLACLSADAATAVAQEADRPDDASHGARADGSDVVLTYYDKRYPLDVAGWAADAGFASDAAAGAMIGRL